MTIFSLIKSGDLAAVSSTLQQQPSLLSVPGDYGGGSDGRPLHAAAYHGRTEIVRLLGEVGAEIHWRDEDGDTALNMAAMEGRNGAAGALLDLGGRTEDGDNDCVTPLRTASYWGHVEVVQLLLDHGASTSAQDGNGETPLYWAAEENNVSCVAALVRGGAEDTVSGGWTGGTGHVGHACTGRVHNPQREHFKNVCK
jgi:ankyrin repeat protein